MNNLKLNCEKMIKYQDDEYFGKHLVLSVFGCNDKIHDVEYWKKWISELIIQIDMVPHGPLHIDEFGEGDIFGISAMQFIETSSIVMHNQRKNNGIHLDVFSCKDFDEEIIIRKINDSFSPDIETLRYQIIFR